MVIKIWEPKPRTQVRNQNLGSNMGIKKENPKWTSKKWKSHMGTKT